MAKKIFFPLFLLFSSFVNAQPDSSLLVIRFNGGYVDSGSSNGVDYLGALISNTSAWNVGLTVGLPLGKRWEAGIGFEYWKQKTIALSQLYIPKQWIAMQNTSTNMNLITGKLYMAGRWQLFSRLYFTPMLSTGIGKATVVQESITAVRQDFISDGLVLIEDQIISGLWNDESDISYKYFSVDLAPAFSFYFNRHFALNLETGSFSFSTTDWKWDNKQWLANINPAYWKLGIIVTF